MKSGDELEPLVVERVDEGRMKTMAMLLRDPNPIHWDITATKRLGLGDRPINQGPINLSYLMELAIRAAGGDRSALMRFRVRFVGNVLGGERVECRGRVISADDRAVVLELTATSDGRLVLEGEATLAVR